MNITQKCQTQIYTVDTRRYVLMCVLHMNLMNMHGRHADIQRELNHHKYALKTCVYLEIHCTDGSIWIYTADMGMYITQLLNILYR